MIFPLRTLSVAPVALLLALVSIPSHAGAPELFCVGAGGENEAPRLVVKAAGSHVLFVCAVKAKKRHGKLEAVGFRVFMIGKNGKKMPHPLFESELDTKPYRLEKKGQDLVLDELVWDGKANVPAYETKISCDAGGCHVPKPAVCVFEKPKPGSRRALDMLEEYQKGDKAGKVPPKKLIDSLAALAYSGDEDAQGFFKDRGTLSLDGEASDAYFDHQASIGKLKKAGCL